MVMLECLPSSHIPHPHISITATTNKNIAPRNHSPYAHYVTSESPLMVTLSIKDVYLSIIQCYNNILLR